jgi:hypothetical protein
MDGELPPEESGKFNDIAWMDDDFKDEVMLARAIATSLRSMEDDVCPDVVMKGVMAHVRKDIRASMWQRVQSFFLGLNVSHMKPALAVVMLFLVVLTSTRIGRPEQSPAEVAKALDDVKWTLAYLSGVGKTTASSVKSNVIESVGPTSQGAGAKIEN